ncbi:MAG: zf-TFIIB domain-containing protein [bacterium]|nr:MAG: zf-TFIIB domain-containing protein [bacterium]
MSKVPREDVLRHLPIRGREAFTTLGGKFRERIKRRQLNILRSFVPVLKHVLEPDEEILLSARAISPVTVLEELTTGWLIFFIRRCVLVVTNRRILHFPTTPGFTPRNSMSQIRFTDIESLKGGRKIKFRYKSGRGETFHRVLNGKKLGRILSAHMTGSSASTQYRGRHAVCPKCNSALVEARYQCPRCRLEFKNPRTARFLSILFPGGGYFYTRHIFLGLADAIVEISLIVFLLLFLLGHFSGDPRFQGGWPVAAILSAVLLLEKLVTIYHANVFVREYIPVEKTFRRISRG